MNTPDQADRSEQKKCIHPSGRCRVRAVSSPDRTGGIRENHAGELLAGIGEPDFGTIQWNGGRRVMLLQDTSYHISTMTVQEEAGSWHGDAERIVRTAGLTGKEHTDLLRLSRGEVRRLELAAILTGQYDLIVLDEPWAGLDEEARRWVRQLIDSCAWIIVIHQP